MFRQLNRPVNPLQGYAITDVPFLYGTFIISHDRLLTPYIGTYYSFIPLNGSGAYTYAAGYSSISSTAGTFGCTDATVMKSYKSQI